MADRLSKYLREIENLDVKTGIIDISLYRDDLSKVAENPVHNGTHIDFDVENAKIILIDDVLYTGRTVRAAIDAVLDIGRPKEIQLCVLIDRGHKELPIHADYIGRHVPRWLYHAALPFMSFVTHTPDKGALPIVYAAIGKNVKGGDYFGPQGFLEMFGETGRAKSTPISHNREIANRLLDISEKLTGIMYSF